MRFQTASTERSAALRSSVLSLAKTCSPPGPAGPVPCRARMIRLLPDHGLRSRE